MEVPKMNDIPGKYTKIVERYKENGRVPVIIDLSNIDTTKFASDNIADLLRDLSNDSITIYIPNQNCIDTLQYMVDSKITLALKNAS